MIGWILASLVAASAARAAPLNVVLITLESVRADRVGFQGYARPTTPRLDRFARQATRFEVAYAPSGWTLPSLASVLSGRTPERHGATLDGGRLDAAIPTLAQVLGASGYRTAAFVQALPSDPSLGLTAHFQVAPPPDSELSEALVDESLRWISQGSAPFLLWIHTLETHFPYLCPEPYRERFGPGYEGPVHGYDIDRDRELHGRFARYFNGHVPPGRPDPALRDLVRRLRSSPRDLQHFRDHYDGCISYSDAQIGRFLDELGRRGLDRDTLIVITADHGEWLAYSVGGRRPKLAHGGDLDEELLRVPLIIRHPSRGHGRVVRDPVSLVDLAPTILAALGVKPMAGLEGSDLGPLLDGRSEPERLVYASDLRGGRWTRAIRKGPWKALRLMSGDWRLYNVARDPDESVDLFGREPGAFASLTSAYLEAGQRDAGRR